MSKKLEHEKTKMIYYNNYLYELTCDGDKNGYDEMWDKIKSNKSILKSAIKLAKNEWKEDTLLGLKIATAILMNYDEVDSDIYHKLVKIIYTNKTIARKHSQNGDSFLQLTLCNPDLELTEKQKEFAVSEAMMQYGTTLEKEKQQGFQGSGSFDIRYQILMNANWSMEQRANLIYDFYKDDSVYDGVLETWEWNIVNNTEDLKSSYVLLDKTSLYDYSYKDLLGFYNSKDAADRVYEEITMCNLFHQMRPQQWEIKKERESTQNGIAHVKK